eukprot:UN00460
MKLILRKLVGVWSVQIENMTHELTITQGEVEWKGIAGIATLHAKSLKFEIIIDKN